MDFSGKNILIISNNPLSNIQHNGKTLADIFRSVPMENIYQLYLNDALPDYDSKCKYFRISETTMVKTLAGTMWGGGEAVMPIENIAEYKYRADSIVVNSQIVRMLREILWRFGIWKSSRLDKWIERANPDIVFFMAGNMLFPYEVCEYVIEKTEAKLCLFVTDDYISGWNSINPLTRVREKRIRTRLKHMINQSELLVTISDEMAEEYEKLFGKKSIVARNSRDLKTEISQFECIFDPCTYNIVYAGGLHYNRWRTIGIVVREIYKINMHRTKKIILHIYSSQQISNRMRKALEVRGASVFHGGVNADDLKKVMNSANALLFAEAFDKKSEASVRLSFSTKIAEYLSIGIPIIAVGSADVASMKYLKGTAYCITDEEEISARMQGFFDKEEEIGLSGSKCRQKYDTDFSEAVLERNLCQILS